jgi:CUG-BP- and ETR3-like factor
MKRALVQPMSNYAMTYPQQAGMVGLPAAIPGTQPDLATYAPMQPASYPFGGQQYSVPYQGQMMGHQGQSYPSPLAPSLIGMNTAQAAAAAVRTSVGPQTEGKLQPQCWKIN